MPTSMLFALNNEGRVFGLATNSSKWREFPYLGLDFKHLSAVPHFLWAVGGDRQVYLHVHGLDIPIRIKEESFENQRWLPLEGFSKRLLPTDRYNFSSEDGITERRKDKIHLPSMAWQWEGDWHIETCLDGQPLDDDGWTYAVDFPASYHPQKQWSSCVRRRKWVRYRRYSAMNSWCAIAPLHKDPTKEPFIDVCIGGQSVPGSVAGTLQVWAVTAHGRVMWRSGVTTTSPEGVRWSCISVPQGCEIKSISCGPTGIVWAVLWSGRALVRVGITGGSPTGEYWTEVPAPEEKSKLIQVSAGTRAVWAVTSDKRVWFRKGVKSRTDINNLQPGQDDLSHGTGWVEMVGSMAIVSVAPNDQVWAVGSEDRLIYFRTGVTPAELTGKRWRVMHTLIQSQLSRAGSLNLSNHGKLTKQHRSTNSLEHRHSAKDDDWSEETSRSAPTSLRIQPILWNNRALSCSSSTLRRDSGSEERGSVEGPALENSGLQSESEESESGCQRSVAAWSPIRSVGSLVGMEADPNTDPDSALDLEIEKSVFRERDDCVHNPSEPVWEQADTLWSCVEAGAVTVDTDQLPNWFLHGSSNSLAESAVKAPWRTQILEELKNRHIIETKGFENYETITKTSSCVKNGECRCALPGSSNIEDCALELEWTSTESGSVQSGTLTVLSIDSKRTLSQLSVCEITAIMNCSEPGLPRIAVHSVLSTSTGVTPLRLYFSGDIDMDDWMGNLTAVCCQFHNLTEAPSLNSIWATTKLGDIYSFDPVTFQGNQRKGEEELYSQDLELVSRKTPLEWLLVNGFPPSSRICFTGVVLDSAERFHVDFQCNYQSSASNNKAVDVAFHFNPRFTEEIIVRNTKIDGNWGHEEREGALVFSKGSTFVLDIYCWEEAFKVVVNGSVYCYYEHRIKPHLITHVAICGSVDVHTAVYYSKRVILSLSEMFWRQMGGHLQFVETCSKGITWGIAADNTPWVYTRGWGGTFLAGLERSVEGIHPMADTYCCYVYENQRWNPLSGFTTHGLPTDRPMWSDSTGRKKRSKDSIRLLSKHWQWATNWAVDYHIPGGVDKDGWQYAVDFPASYHGKKQFTDYVRRRRWVRQCKLTTSGPWQEVGNSKLCDISIHSTSSLESIYVWAVAPNGDALFRRGVTKSCPVGMTWEHVPCDQSLCSISCGGHGSQVWAVAKDGSTYWRFGITTSNPIGEVWETVEPPSGSTIKQVSVGKYAVWAVDTEGSLFIREDVTPVFPEGTRWRSISTSKTNDGGAAAGGFRHVSASSGDEVWAINNSGVVCRRSGVTNENPSGTNWIIGLQGDWQHITARGHSESSSSTNARKNNTSVNNSVEGLGVGLLAALFLKCKKSAMGLGIAFGSGRSYGDYRITFKYAPYQSKIVKLNQSKKQ
ncbi:tectonin beta-propeller repeat-containing peroxin 23 isoform X2 [Lycorma delicatula]|uniref:tectonin beta-propeller repeat-containing peroxin 23 isoform X2 n=1 Tax=Lycorma delicatula TaxID=130591 RepID=UPI003F511A81